MLKVVTFVISIVFAVITHAGTVITVDKQDYHIDVIEGQLYMVTDTLTQQVWWVKWLKLN